MARILIADTLAQNGVDALSDQHDVDVQTGLSEDELVAAVADVNAIVVRSQTQITAKVIAAAPELEVIGRAGVGVDNIDLDAATDRGVIVVNAPLANTVSAAEHAFGLMLAVARHIPQGVASLRGGEWARSKYMGVELAGRTLGIVGLGRVGTEVATRARAFEMRIIAYDPYVSKERASGLGIELMELEALLAESDFVSLHTTLYDGTRGLINKEHLALMKPEARIINTARGELVDEQALFDAVESGQVAGAAIDVFSTEPAVGNVLTTSDAIIATPHLAASTAEAQDRAATAVAEQILDILDGRPARFAVNAPLVDPETMAVLSPYIDAAEVAASVASQLTPGPVVSARIEYRGEIANYDIAPLRTAVIMGMLGRVSDEHITIVNADRFVELHGIRLDETTGPAVEPYANLVVVNVTGTDGSTRVAATHTPQGVRVVGIGEYEEVDVAPSAAPYALAIENLDRPGMIGRVGTMLGGWDVNVIYMSVAASTKDRALMMLGTHRALTNDELEALTGIENIDSARLITLG
ncbi:MAG TPA: phosphoglycerate dehydrogenase [Dehalococcoidia bacterium]|nr:phosphoglycerate dehydrogenase [Dehalococcoidia bacterium]